MLSGGCAGKLKEMDDVVWEHAHSQLNLTSILEPIITEVRRRPGGTCKKLSLCAWKSTEMPP